MNGWLDGWLVGGWSFIVSCGGRCLFVHLHHPLQQPVTRTSAARDFNIFSNPSSLSPSAALPHWYSGWVAGDVCAGNSVICGRVWTERNCYGIRHWNHRHHPLEKPLCSLRNTYTQSGGTSGGRDDDVKLWCWWWANERVHCCCHTIHPSIHHSSIRRFPSNSAAAHHHLRVVVFVDGASA